MNSSVDTSTAKSYLDFSGLESLRAQADKDQSKAIKETAQHFEGMFIQMMLKSMREANNAFKDPSNESSARESFEDLYDKEVSSQMAKRGSLGVADFVQRAVQQNQSASTAAVLQARQKQQGLPLHSESVPMSLQSPTQQGLPLSKPAAIKSLREIKQGLSLRNGS